MRKTGQDFMKLDAELTKESVEICSTSSALANAN